MPLPPLSLDKSYFICEATSLETSQGPKEMSETLNKMYCLQYVKLKLDVKLKMKNQNEKMFR